MQGNQVGFESSFAQHLDGEQRRAVLEALGASINPDSTLGEILDAAEALGWSEKMGELSLADLAEALLAPEGDESAALEADAAQGEEALEDEALEDEEELDEDEEDLEDDDEEEDELDEYEDDDELDEEEDEEEEDEDEELEEPAPPRRKAAGGTKAASKKTAKKAAASKKPAKKAASKKTAKKAPASKKSAKKAPASKKSAKKAAASDGFSSKKTTKKTAGKKTTKSKLTAVDVDERMSLEQAAEFFLPYVEELGEATMQSLEELTSVSRRKLRFHVGQLVKHGYLERHGMGRGTFYTKL